jgi:circadian clock protein KaiC
MTTKHSDGRLPTGVRNFDAILGGGLPKASVTVIGGPPGSGKTIFTQQICFHAASPKNRVLYVSTLSEPTAKTLRYLKPFAFFDAKKMEEDIQFVDMGVILRSSGLEQASTRIMERVKKLKPAILVIDSFKAFDDLSRSSEELRKFGYELAVNLMAWDVTGLLVGEYAMKDYAGNPLFSVVDGLITLAQRQSSGEEQRFIQVVKMRGSAQSRDPHPFVITSQGVEVFAPRVTITRQSHGEQEREAKRCKTGIERLDELLGEGIPRGSSLLIGGVAGTGKTALLMEFIYRGAQMGEKGVVFSFEETPERLISTARGMGWDLEAEIARGMVELVFIAQPDIMVESDLLMISEKVHSAGAKRVAIDSISVFLHKVQEPQLCREKIFQLATIVQNTSAVGFFATDIPYGSKAISRLGVEETVVDGVILLSSTEEGLERQRYIEIYKLRNTAHSKGRHNMLIATGGIQVFPRYAEETLYEPAPALEMGERLSSGTPGLDELVGGGLLRRSATLVAGSAGIGKSTLGLQFLLAGATRQEPGILFSLEESPEQILGSADAIRLPLRKFVDAGLIEIVFLSQARVRTAQFFTVLGERIVGRKARRLVLDGVSHIVRESQALDETRRLLAKLVAMFKSHDVTSILTMESSALHFGDDVTERGFSPVADNLLMLRYLANAGEFSPALAVIKTRGSAHDRGTFRLHVGEGGVSIGARVEK